MPSPSTSGPDSRAAPSLRREPIPAFASGKILFNTDRRVERVLEALLVAPPKE